VNAVNEQKDWLGRGWAYPVQIDRRTGAIDVSEYEADIHQAMRIIIGTSRGERLMRPDFGCGIHDLVFEVMDTATLTRIETAVRESLTKYEARIELLGVDVDPLYAAEGKLLVEIDYRIRQTNQIGNFVYPFYFREGGADVDLGGR
jgi:phage baseplate assembly protein W